MALELLQDLEPVDLRQPQVEQDQSRDRCAVAERAATMHVVERLFPVAGHRHRIGELPAFERPQRELHVGGVVLHQQDRNRRAHASPPVFAGSARENVLP